MRDDETIIKCGLGTVEVRNDHGPLPERNEGQVYLEVRNDATEKAAFVGVQADELRDAIDKAVGPREESRPRVFFAPAGTPLPAPGTSPEDAGFEPLGWIDGASLVFEEPEPEEPEPEKPYRPIDRDRLLRHIEDIEATLARRNTRHEADQERIRELEARVEELENPEPLTIDEHIEAAWGAAHVPADGKIRPGERYIFRFENGNVSQNVAHTTITAGHKYRLIDPRTEPTPDERRKEYEEQGLEEWEIELLLSHNRS